MDRDGGFDLSTVFRITLSPGQNDRPVQRRAPAFVDIGGVRLRLAVNGEGPPLLFLFGSGMGATIENAQPILDRFSSVFTVACPDQRGLGMSDVPPGPWTMADYASDAFGVADYLGWDRFNVIGLSFGGMVALEMAATHPERLERLVLWGATPGGTAPSYPLHELEKLPDHERFRVFPGIIDTRLRDRPPDGDPPGSRIDTQARTEPDERRKRGLTLQLEARRGYDVLGRLGWLDCPTFIGAGTFDGLAPLANVKALLSEIPHGELHVYQAGHLFFTESEALDDTLQFLSAKHSEPEVARTPVPTPTLDWRSLADLVADQADRTPEAIAIRSGGQTGTYAELAKYSHQLARLLIGRGVGPDSIVPILMDRSPLAVVAMLGVLAAGGAFLPMDPDAPLARSQVMMDDCDAALMITTSDHSSTAALLGCGEALVLDDPDLSVVLAGMSPDRVSDFERRAPLGAHHLAFVIYTSGSTGIPKGACNTQAGVVNCLRWMRDELGLGPDDRVLHQITLIFDVSVVEIFAPLISGGSVVIARPRGQNESAYIAELIQTERVTVAFFVPTLFQFFLEEAAATRCRTLRNIVTLGEVLTGTVQEYCHSRLPWVTLWNSYGPCEAAVLITLWRCRPSDGTRPPPIGTPCPNADLFVLGEHLQPVPAGTQGELFVAGVPVARGYLARPELTDERFLPSPFGPPGGRMYRTGDIVSLRPDGAFEFHGRHDTQIKINGVRIEPAEIESEIAALPGIARVAVIAREIDGQQRLIAYLITSAGSDPSSPAALSATLAARLPWSMVPSYFVFLDAFPQTASGKLAARELPDPDFATDERIDLYTGAETRVRDLWEEVLGHRQFGPTDNFFMVGGRSLDAARLKARFEEQLGRDVPLPELFRFATLREQAEWIVGHTTPGDDGFLAGGGLLAATGVELHPGLAVAASAGQSRLWYLHQRDPQLTAYYLRQLWRLRGELDVSALSSALSALVERHPTLRTSFRVEAGELVQVIGAPYEVALDTEILNDRDPYEVVDRWWRLEASDPFNLAAGVLVRARLLQISSDDHLLLFNHHHIASDGWSVTVLIRELSLLYNAFRVGEQVVLPAQAFTYIDYSRWQRQRLDGDRLSQLLEYWKPQLEGAEPLGMPTDRPRGLVAAHSADSVDFTVDRDVLRPFDELCRQEGATLQMGLVAVVAALLGRYARQDDLVVGVPTLGRDHPGFEDIVGFFVNILPIRAHMEGTLSFRDLLRQVRATSLAAYQHAELPFDRMVAESSEGLQSGDTPLVQVIVQLDDDTARHSLQLDHVTAEAIAPAGLAARFELEFSFRRVPGGGLSARLMYDSGLFDRARIHRLQTHLTTLLSSASALPDTAVAELVIPTSDELDLISQWQQGPPVECAELCVHQLFSARVALHPDAVAMVCGEHEVSYRELDARANRLAHRLIEAGVVADSIVAVCLGRSADLIVTLLAILKSGGAYLPIDPDWPAARKKSALAAIGPLRWTLTTDPRAGEWESPERLVDPRDPELSAYPCEPPDATGHHAGQLAYVNFTSGSTGEPKGVMIEHRGILRLLDQHLPWRIGSGDRMLHMAPAAFDAATLEIWLPLLSGATLVLAPDERPDLGKLAELIATQQISVLWLTASLFHAMAEHRPDVLAGVPRLLAGGEVLEPEAVRSVLRLMPPEHVIINGYGPTESTTFASYHTMPASTVLPEHESIPIGRPLPGTTLRVLDSRGAPCPVGIPGELFIGGTGLARGYLNSAELTAIKFTTDPQGSGERLYRTGDLASWGPTGSLTFHGRTDDQIKVRGHRIDLAEIATTLAEHPAVARAVVVPSRTNSAKNELVIVAYWTRRPGATASSAELRAFLVGGLPQAMIPSAFVALEYIPLKPNGKLDRDSLPEPLADDEATAPDTPTERRLHAIWAVVLGHSWFGSTDNFFMVGGHSLQTVRLQARINEEFNISFPLSILIGSPTIRHQAQWLSGEVSATTSDTHLVTIQPAGDRAPLIGVHGWSGTLFHFVDIARELAPHRPFLGLQPPGGDELSSDLSVEKLAATYAESIIARIPEGPIHLVGHSAGGWYAHAVAAALLERGRTIGLLAIFDSHAEGANVDPDVQERIRPWDLEFGPPRLLGVDDPWVNLARRFRPPRLPVTVDLFSPNWSMSLLEETWRDYALRGIRSHVMFDSHNDFQRAENAPALARALESALAAAEARLDEEASIA